MGVCLFWSPFACLFVFFYPKAWFLSVLLRTLLDINTDKQDNTRTAIKRSAKRDAFHFHAVSEKQSHLWRALAPS